MSDSQDLTRWNRAGLSRFRYVDANAATLLEALRDELKQRFPSWSAVQGDESAENETEAESLLRVLDQYRGERGDMLWEVTRGLARSAHVLSEHLDVYANEGYLETATQWENLRRLVGMIDYSPAPPASASTWLALNVKTSRSGVVETGFKVKYSPADGGEAVIFETLEDVEVDARLNAVRLAGWNRSELGLKDASGDDGSGDDGADGDGDGEEDGTGGGEAAVAISGVSLWVAGEDDDISGGDLGLVIHAPDEADEEAVIVQVAQRDAETGVLTLDGLSGLDWAVADLRSELKAGQVRRARLNGGYMVHLDMDTGLSVGDALAWKDDEDAWLYALVSAADGDRIRLGYSSSASLPEAGAEIYKLARINAPADDSSFTMGAVDVMVTGMYRRGERLRELTSSHYTRYGKGKDDPDMAVGEETVESAYAVIRTTESSGRGQASVGDTDAVYILYAGMEHIATVVDPSVDGFVFRGGPGELSSGQWVIGEDGEGGQWALKLTAVTQGEGSFSIGFEDQGLFDDTGLSRLHGPFTVVLEPSGADRNRSTLARGYTLSLDLDSMATEASAGSGSVSNTEDDADSAAFPEAFGVGRKLIVEQVAESEEGDPQYSGAVTATVTAVDADSGSITIDTDLGAEQGFTLGNTVIRANVVKAGHGESKPARTLGSGDATRRNQSFVFDANAVSFVADAAMSTGVSAAIDVQVDGRSWTQVSDLNDSEPEDHHYRIRMTEDGQIRLIFGDGEHGRRLPTGSNNVRLSWRKGHGLAGNVAAGGLSKPVKPHYLLDSVRQPLDAAGGGETEQTDSLRDDAPASLFALERAVSLSDFEALARSQSSVAQAKAFSVLSAGRGERVEVVVVPSGGGALGDLESTLALMLESHATPGVEVIISAYEAVRIRLTVTLRVDSSAYEGFRVVESVRQALIQGLGLDVRKLGDPLYRAAIYALVESVEGVQNADCVISGFSVDEGCAEPRVSRLRNGEIRALRATARQLIYLDDAGGDLSVDYEDYGQ